MTDLAIIITAMNEAVWLEKLLPTLLEHRGAVDVDVVVADIESTDHTVELIRASPGVRRVAVVNHGFAHANNVALQTTNARFVLFLNADTEIVAGTFADLVAAMEERPTVGLIGVRQLDPQGAIYPTMRRFASARRAFAQALGSERLAPRLGQRVLDTTLYDTETVCEWTIGSFMLVRREALMAAGTMDERFFFTGEEQDFCLRISRAGWDIRHLPAMTIIHHVGKRGVSNRFAAQSAFAERQYATLNFGRVQRATFLGALRLNYVLRAIPSPGRQASSGAARAALKALRPNAEPPFAPPPRTALPAGQFDLVSSGKPA